MKKLSTKQLLRAEKRREKLFAKEIKRKAKRAYVKQYYREMAVKYRRAMRKARLGL